MSYCAAIVASCGAGAAVRTACKGLTAKATGGKLVVLNALVATIACGAGGFANNWCIR